MSFTPNDASQWTTASDDQAGYTYPTTMAYDLTHLPATADAWTTAGMETRSSPTFHDPMYSYMGATDNMGTWDSSYQYDTTGNMTDEQLQHLYGYEEGTEAQEAAEASGEEGSSSKKKGKKRPPRKYTSEQLAKRREQNRKAQRVYCDCKDQRIKELEEELEEQLAAASQQTEVISSAIEALRAEHAALTCSLALGVLLPLGILLMWDILLRLGSSC